MTVLRLQDNSAFSWTSRADPNAVEVSANFVPLADGTADEISFYRGTTTLALGPDRLRLYDQASQQAIAEVLAPTDSGAVGWQRTSITPVTLVAGRAYLVAAHYPAGGGYVDSAANSVPAPPYPATWWTTGYRRYSYSGNVASAPGGTDNSALYGVDLRMDLGVPVTPPAATPADVDNSLADWLISTSDNTHQTDGLPWLIKTELDATKILAQGAYDVLTTTPASGSNLTAFLTAMGPTILAAMGTFFATANARLNGASGGGGSAFFGPGGTQVSAGVEEIIATLANPAVQYPLSWPALSDPAWEVVDSTPFADTLWWEVPAHLYVIHFDTWAPYKTQTVLPGNTWIRRLGWWAPMKGTNLGERRYVEFSDSQAENRGLFMDGLYLSAKPGSAGTVTAYLLHAV